MSFSLALAVLAGLAVLVVAQLRRRRLRRRLDAGLMEVGLSSLEPSPSPRSLAMAGQWAGRSVVVSATSPFLSLEVLRVEIAVHRVLPGLSARLVGAGHLPRQSEEPETGDVGFDARVAVRSDDYPGLVSLYPGVRIELRRLLEQGWTLTAGTLTLETSWSGGRDLALQGWRASVSALLAAVDASSSDLGHRLSREPDVAVRGELLHALATYGPEFIRRILPASAVEDRAAPVAALAAALLRDGAAWDRAPPWSRDQVLSQAPLQLVALHQHRRDEDALLPLAEHWDESVVIPALAALGAIGGRDTVVRLRDLVTRRSLSGPMGHAAKAAIAQIQARLAGAERGQLTVVEAAGGALAVAEGGVVAIAAPATPEEDECRT